MGPDEQLPVVEQPSEVEFATPVETEAEQKAQAEAELTPPDYAPIEQAVPPPVAEFDDVVKPQQVFEPQVVGPEFGTPLPPRVFEPQIVDPEFGTPLPPHVLEQGDDSVEERQTEKIMIREADIADQDMAGMVGVDKFTYKKSLQFDQAVPTPEVGQENATEQIVRYVSGAGKALSRAMLDLQEGWGETPEAVLGGARNAVQAMSDLIDDTAQWAARKGLYKGEEFVESRGKEGIIPDLPQMGDPNSNTGKVIKEASQLITGFLAASKVIKGTGWLVQGARGAFADFAAFDETDDTLAEFFEKNGMGNVLTEFLASQEGDSKATKRFKNAVEGFGLGVVADGLIHVAKAVKNARVGRAIQRNFNKWLGVEPEAIPPKVNKRAVRVLGDPDGETFVKRSAYKMRQADAEMQGVKTSDVKGRPKKMKDEVYINWAKINTPEDIKTVLRKMSQMGKESIKDAQRGVRSWETTKLAASRKNAFDTLMARRPGQALNAEEFAAARQLWHTSGDMVRKTAKLVEDFPTEENAFIFRKMMSIHHAIQKELMGARTETARALNIWKMPVGTDEAMAAQIDNVLSANGGVDAAKAMAQRVSRLAEAGGDADSLIEQFVQGTAFARTRKAVQQVFINSLLSNPQTHVVNHLSNFSVAAIQVAERGLGEGISRLLGTKGGVAPGETLALAQGLMQGMKEGLGLLGRKITRKPGDMLEGAAEVKRLKGDFSGSNFRKFEGSGGGALSSETWNLTKDTWIARGFDAADNLTSLPGRLLSESDELWKNLGFRMELNAQAVRQATKEFAGTSYTQKQVNERVAELVSRVSDGLDPKEAALREKIRTEAADAALYQTFQNKPGELVSGMSRLADKSKFSAMARFLVPFRNTPANILSFTMERTPFAPLTKRFQEAIAAGGAKRDIALARLSFGSMVSMVTMDFALNGRVSGRGPSNPAERATLTRTGWKPYSVKIGDTWVSYNRLDPAGFIMGMSADIADAVRNAQGDLGDKEFGRVMSMMALTVANNAMSKTYMSGLSDFIAAIQNNQIQGQSWLKGAVSSFVPAGVAGVSRAIDPLQRAADTEIEAIMRRIPFFSEGLPKYRDLYGREVKYRSHLGGLYDYLSPIYVSTQTPEPIDKEMTRLGYYPDLPDRIQTFEAFNLPGQVSADVRLDAKQFSRLLEIAGQEVKLAGIWGGRKTMLDALNALVKSPVYKRAGDGKEGGKAGMIRSTIARYREEAKRRLLQEDKGLQADWMINKHKKGTKYKFQEKLVPIGRPSR